VASKAKRTHTLDTPNPGPSANLTAVTTVAPVVSCGTGELFYPFSTNLTRSTVGIPDEFTKIFGVFLCNTLILLKEF